MPRERPAKSIAEPASHTVGVVLAGGRGRRLGRDKAILELDGKGLAERAAATLAGVFRDVVVAAPPGSAAAGLELPLAADRFLAAGPLAGVEAGLAWAAGRPIFVLACDLPLAGQALVRHLLAAADRSPRGAAAWVAADGGGSQPLCGLYGAGCLEVAGRCLRAGQRAMRGFLDRLETTEVRLTAALPFYHPELLLNVNRPADLERARCLVGRAAAG